MNVGYPTRVLCAFHLHHLSPSVHRAECCTWWACESPTTASWLTANSPESEHWSMESVCDLISNDDDIPRNLHNTPSSSTSTTCFSRLHVLSLCEWALPGIRWININIGNVIVIGKLPCSWHYESEWINGIKPLLVLELNTVLKKEKGHHNWIDPMYNITANIVVY